MVENGKAKGLRRVLEERGINTANMVGSDMRKILGSHKDFCNEKTIVERFILDKGHHIFFIPKFHCELNPIERVWGEAKRYTRAHTNFTLPRLRTLIQPALDSVSLDLIRKYFRKARDYERAYREHYKGGVEVEQAVKKFKSRRRAFFE